MSEHRELRKRLAELGDPACNCQECKPLPGTPEAEAQYERSTLQCAENIKAAQAGGEPQFNSGYHTPMPTFAQAESAAASVEGGAASFWPVWCKRNNFAVDGAGSSVAQLFAEAYLAQSTPTAEVINRLVEWDKKYPRDRYQIVEYGTMRQCEKELDEICELAKLALAALRGWKG